MHSPTTGAILDSDNGGSYRGWLIVLALGLACVTACRRSARDANESEARVHPVTTITAKIERLRKTASGIGSLQAVEQVELRAEVAGLVREVLFEEGQRVEEGKLLFRLDDAELQQQRASRAAALDAAGADLANARWQFDRLRALREQGVAAVEEYKNARDRYRAAEATVKRLKAELDMIGEQIADTRIRAPLTGRLTEHLVDVGDFVDAGDPLASLYAVDPIELAFWLPERCGPHVQVDQPVTATTTAYPERRLDGQLAFVSPVVDPRTRSFQVKARFPNPDGSLKPGVFAAGHVTVDTQDDCPVIPEECLVSLRSGYVVFVVRGGVARERDVTIGLRAAGRVEIQEGVEPGEEVVRAGHMQLADGDAVRVTEGRLEDGPATRTATTRSAEGDAQP